MRLCVLVLLAILVYAVRGGETVAPQKEVPDINPATGKVQPPKAEIIELREVVSASGRVVVDKELPEAAKGVEALKQVDIPKTAMKVDITLDLPPPRDKMELMLDGAGRGLDKFFRNLDHTLDKAMKKLEADQAERSTLKF